MESEHNGTHVLIPYRYRHRNVHYAAVTEIYKGSVQAHGLKSGKRIALAAALARHGVFAYDGAEIRAHTVLRYGRPLVVYRDYGGAGSLRYLILHDFPTRNIEY